MYRVCQIKFCAPIDVYVDFNTFVNIEALILKSYIYENYQFSVTSSARYLLYNPRISIIITS